MEDKQKEAREQIERYSEFDEIKDIEELNKYTMVVAGNEIFVEKIISNRLEIYYKNVTSILNLYYKY